LSKRKTKERACIKKKNKLVRKEGINFFLHTIKIKIKIKCFWKIEIIITQKNFTSDFWKRPSQNIVSIIRPTQPPTQKKSYSTPKSPANKVSTPSTKGPKKEKKTLT
jgi:hypothetical protein